MSVDRPGHEYWVTRDYSGEGGALSLNKNNLGLFLYHLLKLEGSVSSVHALNAKYDNSYVQMSISLPEGKAAELERLTGIKLERPSFLQPASGFGF